MFRGAAEVHRKERIPKEWQAWYKAKAAEIGVPKNDAELARKAGLSWMLESLRIYAPVSASAEALPPYDEMRDMITLELNMQSEMMEVEKGYLFRIGSEVHIPSGVALEVIRALSFRDQESIVRDHFKRGRASHAQFTEGQIADQDAVHVALMEERKKNLSPMQYLVAMSLQEWAQIFCRQFSTYLNSLPANRTAGDLPQLYMLALECEHATFRESSTSTSLFSAVQKAEVFLASSENSVVQALMPHDDRELLMEMQGQVADNPTHEGAARALLKCVHKMAVTYLGDTFMVGPQGFLRSAEAGRTLEHIVELADDFLASPVDPSTRRSTWS